MTWVARSKLGDFPLTLEVSWGLPDLSFSVQQMVIWKSGDELITPSKVNTNYNICQGSSPGMQTAQICKKHARTVHTCSQSRGDCGNSFWHERGGKWLTIVIGSSGRAAEASKLHLRLPRDWVVYSFLEVFSSFEGGASNHWRGREHLWNYYGYGIRATVRV